MDYYTSIKHKLYKAFSYSRSEWWVLTRVWVLLLFVDLGLRTLPFRRLRKILASGLPAPCINDHENVAATTRYLKRWVDTATRHHLYPMTCLRRSLVLQRLSSQQGIALDLRIGVRKEGDKLNAHAWLEYHGQPINEPEAVGKRFTPLVAPETKQRVRS